MLERIKKVAGPAGNLFGLSIPDARPFLKELSKDLRSETKRSLDVLNLRSADVHPISELYLAIENLTNSGSVVRRASVVKECVRAERALDLIDTEIGFAMNLIRDGVISRSIDAGEIALRTSNLLFAARQNIKQTFGLTTALTIDIPINNTEAAKQRLLDGIQKDGLTEVSQVRKMVLASAMLFQIKQSLFPPERMIVGATRRTGQDIRVDALFDVTGEASASGVKADPDRLGQALIAMAESGTYFGLWIHSHPGSGCGATYPSSIDTTQHADWLRDYSPDLVSAIMVSDRYLRFWGDALETGNVEVAINGGGVETVSAEERVYRLSF